MPPHVAVKEAARKQPTTVFDSHGGNATAPGISFDVMVAVVALFISRTSPPRRSKAGCNFSRLYAW
jgi:hypothetical protein